MKKPIPLLAIATLVSPSLQAATIAYDFEDVLKIVDGTYGTTNDSYTGPDVDTAAGVGAGAFSVADGTRNQGTIGNQNGTAGANIGGSVRAGISAIGTGGATVFAQSMSFSLDIMAGANADLSSISFVHGYFNNANGNGNTTDITWYLRVTEGANTYSYDSSASAWTHNGGTNYQDNPGSPFTVTLDPALSNLSDTTVDFTWTFSGQRGHNLNNQSNWLDDVELTLTSVPEPSSTALIGLAGACLLLRRRR